MSADKIALFSGRFDDVHKSHIINIQRLGQKYKKVIVVILDHTEQEYPVSYRYKALSEALSYSKGNYEVLVNTIHFAEITKDEWDKYGADVYVSGNLDCLKHIEGIGIETEYVERAYEDHATYGRNYKKIKELLN